MTKPICKKRTCMNFGKSLRLDIDADNRERWICDCGDSQIPNWRKCPRCEAQVKYRRNSKTGQEFLGCANYPKCRGTQNVLGKYPSCIRCGRRDGMTISYWLHNRSEWTPESESDHLACMHCGAYRLIVNAPWTCPLCAGQMEEDDPWAVVNHFQYSTIQSEVANRLRVFEFRNGLDVRAVTYLFCRSSVQYREMLQLVTCPSSTWESSQLPPRIKATTGACTGPRILVPGTFVEEIYRLYSDEVSQRANFRMESPADDGYTDENQDHYMRSVGSGGFSEREEYDQADFQEEMSRLQPSQKSFGFNPTFAEIEYAKLMATVNRALLLGRLSYLNKGFRATQRDWECHHCQSRFKLPDRTGSPPYPYWRFNIGVDDYWRCPNCHNSRFVSPLVEPR